MNNKKSFIEKIKQAQDITQRLMNGEKVKCPKCGENLIFHEKGSGYHPSIFCPNGDYKISMEYADD